jgi:hypothetical protein
MPRYVKTICDELRGKELYGIFSLLYGDSSHLLGGNGGLYSGDCEECSLWDLA